MENLSTFLSEAQLQRITRAAAEEIRLFLAFVNDPHRNGSIYCSLKKKKEWLSRLTPDMRKAAAAYQKDPKAFNNAEMIRMGEGIEDAIKNFIRIEVRKAKGVAGAAQVVSKGIEGEFRVAAFDALRSKADIPKEAVTIKLAGRSSIEFNVAGVDKALPFKYLENHFEDVLKEMQYTPGKRIDSSKYKTIIAADGDSTMYGGPTLTSLPRLDQSPTKKPLNEFLELGGVFMIISGNNLERTQVRIQNGIRNEYKSRCILVGNGAASMSVFDRKGNLKEIEDYRKRALKYVKFKDKAKGLDVIYIGNDGHPHGNDIEGFRAVGFDRSFLVEQEGAVIDKNLKKNFVPGEERAAAKVLEAIIGVIKTKEKNPVFTKETIEAVMKRLK